MRHYISSDNGRMWGCVLQGEKINAMSTRGCLRGLRLGKASLAQLKEEIPARQHCGQQCMSLLSEERRACCILRAAQSVFSLPFPPPSSVTISSTEPRRPPWNLLCSPVDPDSPFSFQSGQPYPSHSILPLKQSSSRGWGWCCYLKP